MTTARLDGKRVLVVGASAGIGRAFAIRAVQEGAEVVMTARRKEALAEAIAEAGGGSLVTADLCVPDDCRRLAAEAIDILGTIDLVVFAAGTSQLGPLESVDAQEWATTLGTNVIGINMAIGALLPGLAPGALVAALSSEAVGHPYYWLGPYAASKAALEESFRGWRLERPEFRFSAIAVGATVPTEFGGSFDPSKLGEALGIWATHGRATAGMMMVDDLADVLLGVLSAALPYPGVGMEYMMLRTPSAPISSDDVMKAAAEAMGTL